VPPSLEASAPPTNGPPDEAGAERVMDSPDSLRLGHAKQLRDVLQRFAAEYDLEEHSDRAGRPDAWSEGATGGCVLCADPGPALAGMLSALEAAIEGADEAEVVGHE